MIAQRISTRAETRDDCIDITISDSLKQKAKDLQSDPTVQAGRAHLRRKDNKRNYKEMLDGNHAMRKTIMDEQVEIRQKYSQDIGEDGQNEAIESCRLLRAPARATKKDKTFESEADLIADQDELDSSSDESFDDKLDNMDEEEFMLGTKGPKKGGPVGKKNAIDKTGDTNADIL